MSIGAVLYFNPTPVTVHNLFHDCQTKTRSWCARLTRRPAAVEPFEQMGQIIGTYPQTSILHTETHLGTAIMLPDYCLD
jgi:hypothetical protein